MFCLSLSRRLLVLNGLSSSFLLLFYFGSLSAFFFLVWVIRWLHLLRIDLFFSHHLLFVLSRSNFSLNINWLDNKNCLFNHWLTVFFIKCSKSFELFSWYYFVRHLLIALSHIFHYFCEIWRCRPYRFCAILRYIPCLKLFFGTKHTLKTLRSGA